MTQAIDYQTMIRTDEKCEVVFVDKYDDKLWMSIQINGGCARTILTKDQAREMIDAMNRILEAA